MSLRIKVLLIVTCAMLAGGYLYLRVLAHRVDFENSPHREKSVHTRLSEAALQSSNPSQGVTLYFPSYDEGKLVPETRPLALAEAVPDQIRQIVLALLEGSNLGRNAPLPPATTVRAAFLTPEGTVYLDLSSEAQSSSAPGVRAEYLAIYSIVNSITVNIPSVKQVHFLIQGQEADTLNGHIDLTSPFVAEVTASTPSPAR